MAITTEELNLVKWVFGLIAALDVLLYLLFLTAARLPNSSLRAAIWKIIFEVDAAADYLENSQKRAEAVRRIMDILGWRRIFIPDWLVGWMLDAELAIIREIEKVTGFQGKLAGGGAVAGGKASLWLSPKN